MDDTGELTGPAPTRTSRPRGSMVGRYLLLERLGGGGGGEVFAAFDPVLDRKVALKFLHGSRATEEALVREGRLLAKVVHPAVVEVHEVASHEGRPFMAMELVDRGDLASFAKEAREQEAHARLLDALCTVAEGIAAAHDADVVHGDIKPSNVLRAPSDKLKVSDFGIGRLRAEATEGGGHPIGTPTFMAPEQHEGRVPDERSDQYSFCLTAWYSLLGSNPFDVGDTSLATTRGADDTDERGRLEEGKRAGPPSWPGVRGLPRSVGDVLRRGLDPDPDRRWPSMQALLAALRPDPARRRNQRMLAVGGGVAVITAAVFGVQRYDEARREAACEAARSELDGVWDDEAREAVRGALLASETGYAKATLERVVPRIDAWAETWGEHRVEACRNHQVTRTWNDATSERAQWCLEEHLVELGAAVTELRTGGEGVVSRAVSVASALPNVAGCTDPSILAKRPDPPTRDLYDTTLEAVRLIARAETLVRLGRYTDGLAVTRDAQTLLGSAEASPLFASALYLEGRILSKDVDAHAAEAKLIEAYKVASTARNWEVAAGTAETLTFVVGRLAGRPRDGRTWLTQAEVAASLAGDPFGVHETARASNLAVLENAAGNYDEAEALHLHAIELAKSSFGEDHPVVSARLGNLAAVYIRQARYAEAKAVYENALEREERVLGPDHPDSLGTRGNLAAVLQFLGDTKASADMLREVLVRRERVLGPNHPEVAQGLENLATVLNDLGQHEEARTMLERALDIRSSEGETLPMALTLSILASVHSAQARPDEALELRLRSLKIHEDNQGPEHSDVGETLINLGTDYFQMNRYDEASAAFSRAKTIFEAAFGSEHPSLGAAINNLGDVALEQGDYDTAIERYREAHAMWSKTLGDDHRSRRPCSPIGEARSSSTAMRPKHARCWSERSRHSVRVAERRSRSRMRRSISPRRSWQREASEPRPWPMLATPARRSRSWANAAGRTSSASTPGSPTTPSSSNASPTR